MIFGVSMSLEQMDMLKRLQQECRDLEDEAGISIAMTRAREGRVIPLGAMGEDASPDEYFADENDYFREKARDAYFSVQDLKLRKRLIAVQRKIDSHILRSFDAEIASAKHAASIATAKIHNQPWTKAAIFSVSAVAFGFWIFGLAGAIAGAVAGFFLGQGVISQAKSQAIAEVNQATEELTNAQKEREHRSLWPECFSSSEEVLGDREPHLDRESAYENVLRATR